MSKLDYINQKLYDLNLLHEHLIKINQYDKE